MVNQDRLRILEISVAQATAVLSKVPPVIPVAALQADGTFDATTQAVNVYYEGLVHTFYNAAVAILADEKDWPSPVDPGAGAKPPPPVNGTPQSGTPAAGVTPVAAVVPAAIKAVLGLAG